MLICPGGARPVEIRGYYVNSTSYYLVRRAPEVRYNLK
jgi:hypothetical protein